MAIDETVSTDYFEDFIKFPFKLMKILQIELQDVSIFDLTFKEQIKLIGKRIYYWIMIVCMLFTTSMSTRALVFAKPYDMQKFTLGINLSIALSTVFFKGIALYVFGSNIFKVAHDLKRGYTKNEMAKYKIDHYTRHARIFSKIYTFIWMTPLILQFIPVLKEAIMSGEKTFPLFIEFPEIFHAKNIYIYPIFYVYCFWSLTITTITMISFDLALFNLLAAISMEFDILKYDAMQLKSVEESKLVEELRKIVDRQNRLYDIAEDLENIFKYNNFYNFLMASILICFFAFVISTAKDTSQQLLIINYCVSSIYLLFLQCDYGQLLTDASGEVMNGIYECGWEDIKDLKTKKLFIMIIMRTRKPANVTLMGFADLTRNQFTEAMMRAYSYFTLCLQIYSDTKTSFDISSFSGQREAANLISKSYNSKNYDMHHH